MKNAITGRNNKIQFFINLIPKKFRLILNPNRRSIENFIEKKSKEFQKNNKILDAGSGPCPYKNFFNHCNYEATDFLDSYRILDFVCNLENMPKEKEFYDGIISTEVLEHAKNPQKIINEFHRVLKKEGKLIMTLPQEWRIHQEPYNFFYFTKYGIEELLKNSGFKNYKITPKGGYFWLLSDTLRFNGILEQYKKSLLIYYPLKIIEFPLTNILLPLILFPLDFLDKDKKWTIGYLVEATK